MTRRNSAEYAVGEVVAIAQCYDDIFALLTPEQADEVTYMNMKSIYNGKHVINIASSISLFELASTIFFIKNLLIALSFGTNLLQFSQ